VNTQAYAIVTVAVYPHGMPEISTGHHIETHWHFP
jgi:hypothetical protein